MNYSGTGSGTNTLTFTYTIAGGENSLDLDYTSIGALARMGNGHITDALGNEVVYTSALPTPGGPGALGFNKDIVIDTVVRRLRRSTSSRPSSTTPTRPPSLSTSRARSGTTVTGSVTSSGGGTPVALSGTIPGGGTLSLVKDLSGLGDGTVTASATLTDAAGNAGTAGSDSATKDDRHPDGADGQHRPDFVNNANKTTVSIDITGEVGTTVTGSVTSSGGGTPVALSGTIPGGGTLSLVKDLSGLGDGTVTASATLTQPRPATRALPAPIARRRTPSPRRSLM